MKKENSERIHALRNGVLACKDWKNGFPREAKGLQNGKARENVPGLPFGAERTINYMIILLLVDLLLAGKITVMVVWHRKGRR